MPPQLENAAACSFLCSFLSQLGSCLMTLPIIFLKCYYSCTLNSIDYRWFFPACFLSFYSWSRVLKFSWNIHTAPFSVVKAPHDCQKQCGESSWCWIDLQCSQWFGQPNFSRPIMEMDQKAPWLRIVRFNMVQRLPLEGGFEMLRGYYGWTNLCLQHVVCGCDRSWPCKVFWLLDIDVVVGQFPASVVFHWVCRPRIFLFLI